MKGNTMLLPTMTLQQSRTTIVTLCVSYRRTLFTIAKSRVLARQKYDGNPSLWPKRSPAQRKKDISGYKPPDQHEEQTEKGVSGNLLSKKRPRPFQEIGEEEKTAAITQIDHIEAQIVKIEGEIANIRNEVAKTKGQINRVKELIETETC